MRNKRNLFLTAIAALLVPIVALQAGTCVLSQPVRYNRTDWLDGTCTERYRMATSDGFSESLIGQSRDEVERMLGAPDNMDVEKDQVVAYLFRVCRAWSWDIKVLIIEFDKEIVVTADVYR